MMIITSQITPRLSGLTLNATRNLLELCSPALFFHHSWKQYKQYCIVKPSKNKGERRYVGFIIVWFNWWNFGFILFQTIWIISRIKSTQRTFDSLNKFILQWLDHKSSRFWDTYICFPENIRRCCCGGMPSFSSTLSLILSTLSVGSISISISLPVSVCKISRGLKTG